MSRHAAAESLRRSWPRTHLHIVPAPRYAPVEPEPARRTLSRREQRVRRQGPTVGWDIERTRQEAQRVVDQMSRHDAEVLHAEKNLEWLRYATAGAIILGGAGLAFGPGAWRSSTTFVIVYRYFPWKLRGFGLLLLLEGLVHLYALIRHKHELTRVMFILIAATAAAVATSFAAAAIIGKLTGATGPPMWGFFATAAFIQAGRNRRRG